MGCQQLKYQNFSFLEIIHSKKRVSEEKKRINYYPFGMPMPGRIMTGGDYRYAFQGQEKDIETGKEAFQLRMWDGRIGRWLTTDPKGVHYSPYLGMANNPINAIDPDGGSPLTDFINKKTGEHKKVNDGIKQIVLVNNADWDRVGIYDQMHSIGAYPIDFGDTPIKPNNFGVYQFPESGPGFSRYTGAGNNENYSINGKNYNSDNHVSLDGFINLYKTFVSYNELSGHIVHYGDISAYDHRINLNHSTHYLGAAIDIHYIGNGGAELTGNSAYNNASQYYMFMFFHVAQNNGFTSNYSYGNRLIHVGNNNQGAHKNHFHIGLPASLNSIYKNKTYGWEAPINSLNN